jgi:hypothetical protein
MNGWHHPPGAGRDAVSGERPTDSDGIERPTDSDGTERPTDSDRTFDTPMPKCNHCGSFVSTAYVRVFTPDDVKQPRVCPNCPDLIRDGAEVREARSSRSR